MTEDLLQDETPDGNTSGVLQDVSPSIGKESFACPHCGAYTHQYWYDLRAFSREKGSPPVPVGNEWMALIEQDMNIGEDLRDRLRKFGQNIMSGRIFFEESTEEWSKRETANLHLSKCFTCDDIAVWIHERLVHPPKRSGPAPNPDLPDHILGIYDEARSILNLSPRGAAALLRLCIQHLCEHLGEEGEQLNTDIKRLVEKGLDQRVQQALDIVRVVGNNAVHPGQIDLNDNRKVALDLFGLVNLIAEKMISEPKHVKEIYDSVIPEGAKNAIKKRDGKKPIGKSAEDSGENTGEEPASG